MSSALFDPLLELALEVARSGHTARPKVAAPARIEPLLRFAKLPARAKETVLAVLDDDADFRARVAAKASEQTVGRVGMSLLERPPGWREFVDTMVAASEEPVVPSTTVQRQLERRLDAAEQARSRAEAERDEARVELDRVNASLSAAQADLADAKDRADQLEVERDRFAEERQRAVRELKQTEEVMARHIAERKRVENVLDTMAASQLSTDLVGGEVSDAEVREAARGIESALRGVLDQVAELADRATPRRVSAPRRRPLAVPPGVFDDSVEYAEYLFDIPHMTVLVDGYNVTREAHDELPLEEQRRWLEGRIAALVGGSGQRIDIVYDGAEAGTDWQHSTHGGVRTRFTSAGVEADDVIIDEVAAMDPRRSVTVVSSDRRVRDGAAASGANLLHSRQLIALL